MRSKVMNCQHDKYQIFHFKLFFHSLADFLDETGCPDAAMTDITLNGLLLNDSNITVKERNGVAHFFSRAPEHQHIIELVERQRPPKRQDMSSQMNSTSFMSHTANSADFSVTTFKRPMPRGSIRTNRRVSKSKRRSSLSSVNSSLSSNQSNWSMRQKQSMTLNSTIVSDAADRWNESDNKKVRDKLFVTFNFASQFLLSFYSLTYSRQNCMDVDSSVIIFFYDWLLWR